jgi:hypothetical protein
MSEELFEVHGPEKHEVEHAAHAGDSLAGVQTGEIGNACSDTWVTPFVDCMAGCSMRNGYALARGLDHVVAS